MTKNKILFLKGLPASGKTTYALELTEQEDWVRVNKDDIRKTLFPSYKRKDEGKVVSRELDDVKHYLSLDYNVVVDNTHFNPVHQERYEKLAKEKGVDFEVMFIDTPLETCIKRNLKRHNSVPTEVIVGMYSQYIAPLKEKHIEYDDKLEEAIIVDIDGTLAHIDSDNPRSPYDASAADSDTLDDAVATTVATYYQHGYKVIILTGRSGEYLQVTKDWLEANGVQHDEIHSRAAEDKRPDWIIKEELFDRYVRGKYNVKFVFDDRPQVIRMWQSLGLKVFNVGKINVEF